MLRRFGEGGGLDGERLGEAAVAEDLEAVLALAEYARGQQGGGVDLAARLEALEGGDVDLLKGLGEDSGVSTALKKDTLDIPIGRIRQQEGYVYALFL